MNNLDINKNLLLKKYSRNSKSAWKDTGYTVFNHAFFFDQRLSKSALLVCALLAIRTFRGQKFCYPSLRTISTEARCSKSTVVRAIKLLEETKYLRVERGHRNSRRNNQYFLQDVRS
jgi:DNA-binding MarR family transcriptional regulator